MATMTYPPAYLENRTEIRKTIKENKEHINRINKAFTLDEVSKAKSEEFSERKNVSYYENRNNQASLKKLREDTLYGKLGEFGAYNVLTGIGLDIEPPNTEIYDDVKDINYSADLIGKHGHPNVHVKQTHEDYFGEKSWTFQYRNSNGRGGTDNEFFSPITAKDRDEWCAFVWMDDKTKGQVKLIVRKDVVKRCLQPPLFEHVNGTKRVIYLRHFEENVEE